MSDLLSIFYLIALTLLVYRIARSDKLKDLFPLAILLVLGLLLSLYQGANALLFASILVVFDLIAFTYSSKEGFFMVLIGIVYLFFGVQYLSVNIVAQTMLLGLICEFSQIKFNKPKETDKKVETNRDIAQIAFGAIILLLFYSIKTSYAEFVIIMLILLGYLTVNYGASNAQTKVATSLKNLERSYTKFGQGAAWLAIGALATIGFVQDARYVVIIFFAIFIGDALATIIGIRFGKRKLPYNKKKSLAGAIAYFLSVAILPYALYGPLAIPLAALATAVETLPIKLDDNFSVPAVLIVVYIIAEFVVF
ncbi:MAG: hypothetical protein KGH65_00915 [Candidatus Micrarchaeota archaeon]|nr:hypothetical protein [Candidatus Micrarchaeota archaeon]